MKILREGQHPNQIFCGACGTIFIYDTKDVRFDKGRLGKTTDAFRRGTHHYPEAAYIVYCPLCKGKVITGTVAGYTEEEEYW